MIIEDERDIKLKNSSTMLAVESIPRENLTGSSLCLRLTDRFKTGALICKSIMISLRIVFLFFSYLSMRNFNHSLHSKPFLI
jgi:hypothetical protein